MSRLARFLCPACGKQLAGDAFDPTRRPACNDCGRLAQEAWWDQGGEAAAPVRKPRPVPPPLPPSALALAKSRRSAPLLWLSGVLLVGALAAAAWWLIRANAERERVERIASANRIVAAKVVAARAHIARCDFDAAVKVLDDALATASADHLDDARLALIQARQGKANDLLREAVAAVARRNAATARQLLNDYLAHPYADQRSQALLLLDELARASADDEAVRLLARLPDDKLAALAETGRLSDGEQFTDAGMRDLYFDTLYRHLPLEQQSRKNKREALVKEALRKEQMLKERAERLRATPLFQRLTSFAEQTRRQSREQQQRREIEERAFNEFLRQTGVNDPAARARARQELRPGRDGETLTVAIVRKKAAVKKAFRQENDHDKADEDLFDRLVDAELDGLLAEVKAADKR